MRPSLIGVLCFIAALAAVPSWSGYGQRLAVDEPSYALSAESLARDGDLDLANQYALHPEVVPQDAVDAAGAARYAPHPVGLAVVLAPGARFGWWAIRIELAAIFGLLGWAVAALTGRLGLPLWPVLLVMLSPPLLVPSTQVYPETAAALVAVLCVHGLLAPTSRTALAVGAGVAGLIWLGGPKYVLLAAVITALALRRLPRWWPAVAVAALGAGTAAAVNLRLFGGVLPHEGFALYRGAGFLGVIGSQVGLWERTPRVVGLLLDRRFGLLGWMPIVLMAGVGWVRLRPAARWPLWLLAAQWTSATWLALSMRSYAFPGRHLLAALPLVALPVAAAPAAPVAALGAAGAVTSAATLWAVDHRSLAVAVDVFTLRWLPLRAGQALLPDFRTVGAATATASGAWLAGSLGLSWLLSIRRSTSTSVPSWNWRRKAPT